LWKAIVPTPDPAFELEPNYEPTTDSEPNSQELCPPLHHHINNTCIPDFECFSSESDNSKCTFECDSFSTYSSSTSTSSNCLLECGSASELSSNVESICVIEGDMAVNGSVGETTTVTIVGVINVTGDVSIIGQATLKLSSGATLHIGKCLTLDEKAQVVAEVESGVMNGSVLLTFDSSCSSSELSERVKVESKQSVEDMCRDGKPTVEEEKALEEGGMRSQLTLLFVPMSGSDECDVSDESGIDLKILVIAIVVSVAVLAVIVVIVVMAVTRIRKKVVPGSMRLSASNKITQSNL